jgi:hypothetical protein
VEDESGAIKPFVSTFDGLIALRRSDEFKRLSEGTLVEL